MINDLLSRMCNVALWLSLTVFAAFAMLLLSGLGTAPAENHPMQKQGYFVASENVYVPPKPDRLPALVPGQQFICIPDLQQSALYHDAAGGGVISRSDLALKVLTLAQSENKNDTKPLLRFLIVGSSRSVLLPTNEADVTKLPGLQPLVQDDTLRRLQNKYVGKRVWACGAGCFQVVGLTRQPNTEACYYLDNAQPVSIKRLVRVYREQSFVKLGTTDAGVSTRNPLIAVLDLPKRFHWEAASFSTEGKTSPGFASQAQASPQTACLGFMSNHVDDWDFERTFSLVNLYRVHPQWPHELRIGMTPDMAAWVWGWPPEYGSMAQLRRKNKWRYPGVGPFNFWVYFKNGKVVKFGPDGSLP